VRVASAAGIDVPAVPVNFGLLGPLLVKDVQGTVTGISRAKHRVVLAALLLRANATLSCDQLADALWADRQPPHAPAVIRTYVARLRRALGEAGTRLVSRPSGYAVEVRERGELDLAEVEWLCVQSRQAAGARRWELAAELSRAALGLWRGAPLEDIPSEALHLSEAGRLSELRFQLTMTRIDAELQLGGERYLIPELAQLAGEHPLREHVQAQLMLAYYRSGRQAEALRVYDRARGLLAGELGVAPGPELRDLHRRILDAGAAADYARAGSAPSARDAVTMHR
jgi:DNA-binding SARP family transcriptional activator